MTVTVGMITCDTTDALALATWWAEQTGGIITEENEGWYVMVALPTGLVLGFQKVDDPTPGKNRLHLDVVTDDLAAEVERLRAAGAGVVAERGDDSFRWVTMTDPAGNEFCVAPRH
ncbi:VOC family protein [Aeromicrobium duanguangcaii]|uniref:VOC family protein n=1 Tax=Aeromicrobium duanguangcaii TaxID=2968086 RepID=A0ABY5KEI9_9ACTN|nr:VOC family protein [Aeromicrobium duanguangcaii]MCD9154054.1 VOC family protein [Aeromicrobium duanguangcaii]UUI68869.1 VOC family protein [Aeromicrobium duanguangcaii]